MIKAEGYSIWLEPKGKQKEYLDGLISRIATEHGTDKFGFHVTLLGGIVDEEMVVRARMVSLATSLNPFQINLTNKVIMEDSWQKALAIKAQRDSQLMEANWKAQEVFGMRNTDYDPHASLMYAENMPSRIRCTIMQQLPNSIYSVKFPVESIHLYRTEGGIKDWTHVGEFKLGQ